MSLLRIWSLDVLLLKVFELLDINRKVTVMKCILCHSPLVQSLYNEFVTGMNAEIEAMMAANKAAMEESQEEADVSQEEMASRSVFSQGPNLPLLWDFLSRSSTNIRILSHTRYIIGDGSRSNNKEFMQYRDLCLLTIALQVGTEYGKEICLQKGQEWQEAYH